MEVKKEKKKGKSMKAKKAEKQAMEKVLKKNSAMASNQYGSEVNQAKSFTIISEKGSQILRGHLEEYFVKLL